MLIKILVAVAVAVVLCAAVIVYMFCTNDWSK